MVAVAGACAVAGCGLFVDFDDEDAAAAGPSSGSASVTATGTGGSAGGAGAGGASGGAGGGPITSCETDWSAEVVGVWFDEAVVAMVPLGNGRVAIATRVASPLGNPGELDTLVRVIGGAGERLEPFRISHDTGQGPVRNSVALARAGDDVLVAAAAAYGTVRTPLVPTGQAGLVVLRANAARWDGAEVVVECGSPSIEAVSVAAGADGTIAVAANTFTPPGMAGTTYDCGCNERDVPLRKDLLLWPDAAKGACPVQIGTEAADEASASVAILQDRVVLSANYGADTEIFGIAVPFGGGEVTEVDRLVALVEPNEPEPFALWARPVARIWHNGDGGSFLTSPAAGGVIAGGALYGSSAPFMAFDEPNRRLALTRIDASGAVDPFVLVTASSGFLHSVEAGPGCTLIAGLLEDTKQDWMVDDDTGPSFVALLDANGTPTSGLALETDVTYQTANQIFAARGETEIFVAAVYTGAPTIAGETLPLATPHGTVLLRVGLE